MVRVKICGLTRLEDAACAVKSGAWALGFIFYPKSPRFIDPNAVGDILRQLKAQGFTPPCTVGVFVNASPDEIRQAKAQSGIDIVQLHGDESPDFLRSLSDLRVWKVFRLKSESELTLVSQFDAPCEAYLFDAAVAGAYGGTGQLADWGLLTRVKTDKPLIVSGGLHLDNARAAWQQLQPYALDLSSGVEDAPGIKSTQKIQALFHSLGDLS
jgi:phosphoribosylanthranilate isomerase